jgi:hypothetical protein
MYNICSESYYFHVFHNDTLGILGTKSRMTRIGYLAKQYTGRRQTKEKTQHKKPNKDEQHRPHQKPGVIQ